MPTGLYQPMRTVDSIDEIIEGWPWLSARVAQEMVETYGLPHKATASMLVWYYNHPWKRTILWKEGVYHGFPRPHLDILEQTLEYRVPFQKIPELALYNSSLSINQARGEITISCSNEAMNFLTVNLAHEIIIGHLRPAQAKGRHREVVAGLKLHWPEPFTEGLTFEVVRRGYGAGESDESPHPIPWMFKKH
ncbi:MAG: hypothetical protein HYZ63_02735 [Candidatus Andersenbacteria bacterium]|nr:hypothetical protein [Candidatus Andersenbacteria bacterium]